MSTTDTFTQPGTGAANGRVQVISEPLTYSAHLVRDRRSPLGFRAVDDNTEPRSYWHDLLALERWGDPEARGRLERHAQEQEKLFAERRLSLHPYATGEIEARAVNWTAGSGGYFSPPLWLIEYFATAPRPHRVLSALAPNFDLPVGWSSVNLPRLSTGTTVSPQSGLGTPVTDSTLADAQVNAGVFTLAGNLTVPLQLIEQSPVGAHFDWVVFTDMEADYNYQLESHLIYGTGTGEALGILNNLVTSPTAANVAYTDATPTATEIYSSLGKAMAAVGNNRKLPPEMWMMRTARAAWLGSSEDQQQRPLMLSNTAGTGEWDLLTIAVNMNDAIGTTSGGGANEDVVIACRPSDWVILESDIHTDVRYDTPASGMLAAVCQLRRYVAAVCRYPSGHAVVSGTGMIPATGF